MSLTKNRAVLSLRTAARIMIPFQQIFAAFCVLMTEACCHFAPPTRISLFFHQSNSKSVQLLITDNSAKTNRIQREFDSNVAIATFEFSSAPKAPRQKTNFFKPLFETNLAFSLS
jgi:hypothetical protein